MKTIGQRIKQARKLRRLTQQQLADLCGYGSQSAIGNLENQADRKGGNHIYDIAKALNVPTDWLMKGPDTHDLEGYLDDLKSKSETNKVSENTDSAQIYTLRARCMGIIDKMSLSSLHQALDFLSFLDAQAKKNISENHPFSA